MKTGVYPSVRHDFILVVVRCVVAVLRKNTAIPSFRKVMQGVNSL